MILEFMKNAAVLMLICTVLVFAEMYAAKYWFKGFTQKITNATIRRGINMALGFITSFFLAYVQMIALCDVFHGVFSWVNTVAAAGIATGVYLVIEKICGESTVNELGKAFCDFISHSTKFEGELSAKGAKEIAQKLFELGADLDKKVATKEDKAVEEIVKRLDAFLEDGQVTDEEKAEATELLKRVDTSTYEKYKGLLNK